MVWGKLKGFFNSIKTRFNDPGRTRTILVPVKRAGVYVDHDTAMQFSAVFRAVSYISATVAGLPWDVIRETETRTIRLVNHPVWGLLRNRPNFEMGAYSWREIMTAWALSWGNGYSEIEFDGAGRPVALWPITPDRVEVRRDYETEEIVYRISNRYGGSVELPPWRVFHLHGLGFDGLMGYSVISLAARAIGLGISAERCGEDLLANGAMSTGALKHPGKLSPEAKKRMREDFQTIMKGPGNRWNMPIFEEGMDWVDMMINPEDAQMLETRKFQVTDIARWFGLPPHKLQDLEKATFSNIEHQAIEVVNDALMPWVHRLEQEANFKLFTGRERGIRTKINIRGLLRGDDKSRAEYYKIMRELGIYSTNDILKLEDMDPIEGPAGDARIVQLNQTTLERLVSGEAQQQREATLALPAPKEPNKKEPAALALLESAFDRILKRERAQYAQVSHKIDGNDTAFDDWADKFFAKHVDWMRGILEPLTHNVNALLGGEKAFESELSAFIDVHEGRSRSDLRSGNTDDSRANRSATELFNLIWGEFGAIQ